MALALSGKRSHGPIACRIMKVLQLNVRLNEGGAAKMAVDLHRRLLHSEINSRFCYGYGKRAGKSSDESNIPNVLKCTKRLSIIANFFIHQVIGIDLLPPFGMLQQRLIAEIKASDIVHLHVLHSYYMPLAWLISYLVKMNKKVVWTAHDHWLVTGRCAFTDECENWRSGCGACLTWRNYPPSFFDISKSEFVRKRKWINRLGENLKIVSPTEHAATELRGIYSRSEVITIANGIDSEMETAIRNATTFKQEDSLKRPIRVLVIANDLSYEAKTNRNIVRLIAERTKCEIHTVGKKSPFNMSSVVNHGEIFSREELVRLYSSMDVMLFTSTVDSFGLVIAESLACGTPVIAVNTPVSREVLSKVGAYPIESVEEIINCIVKNACLKIYPQNDRKELQKAALRVFSGETMYRNYVSAYRLSLV